MIRMLLDVVHHRHVNLMADARQNPPNEPAVRRGHIAHVVLALVADEVLLAVVGMFFIPTLLA